MSTTMLQRLFVIDSKTGETLHVLPFAFFTLAATWLSWRFWTFTLRPALQPREPPELPYWVPVLGMDFLVLYVYPEYLNSRTTGHAISFFQDTEGTFTRARLYFRNSRKPFALTVAGQRLYIVTSPQDVTDIYKNSKTLTFDEYVRDVMQSIGVSDDGIARLWKTPDHSEDPNRLHKALAHAGEDYYREQLLPGNHLDVLWERVNGLISSSIQWDKLPNNSTTDTLDTTQTFSLLVWTRDVLLKAVIRAFFGERLLELEPRLLEYFTAFDDESWKLTYKYPRSVSKSMYNAMDNMVAGVEAYLRLPKNERLEGAWLIHKMETETRNAGITVHDLAAMITSLVWVILSNAYKLCFWAMAYLLFNPSLHAEIQAEIRSAIGGGEPGLESRLEQCPRLIALYNEVLRLTTASASIRTVESATPLGEFTLRAGGKVLLPFRQLHFNKEVFGDNADEFDPERFLKDGSLSRSPSFRPFGGGSTYCPGRYVAKREVLVFIALALCRFDSISLASNEETEFPKLDTKKPSLGIMMPIAGDDVQVLVRRLGVDMKG